MIIYNQKMLYAFLGALIISFYLLFLPIILHARIIISEIMYDPEGTDTGREWVEVYNTGPDAVDLASYKLFENNINHKLVSVVEDQNIIISSGQFAIIADNPAKFLIDFPSYSGLLIDSAFSLNNTGEPIAIIDGENNVIDRVEYLAEWGGKNNGFSLQKNDSDFWIEATPTVGLKNQQQSEIKANDSNNTETKSSTTTSATSNSTHSGQNDLTNFKEKIDLEIGAGRHRIVTLNTPVDFRAVFNTDKKPKFMWSFGDGLSKKGYEVKHSYKNEGNYNIVLNGLLGTVQTTARTKITVIKPDVEIMSINSGKNVNILLKNKGQTEINLGNFILKAGKKSFRIVSDTIIDSGGQIIIPYQYTNFLIDGDFRPAEIHYPDGGLIYREILSEDILASIVNFLAKKF
jgi:hypothetical protein